MIATVQRYCVEDTIFSLTLVFSPCIRGAISMVYFCETRICNRHCKQPWDCVFRTATETSPCKISKLPIFSTHVITSQNLMTSSDSKWAFIHMWHSVFVVDLITCHFCCFCFVLLWNKPSEPEIMWGISGANIFKTSQIPKPLQFNWLWLWAKYSELL